MHTLLSSLQAKFDLFDIFIREELPEMNEAIDQASGKDEYDMTCALVVIGMKHVEEINLSEADVELLSDQQVWDYMSNLGFFYTSCFVHDAMETMDDWLDSARRQMKLVARRLGLPPRDNLYTYVSKNSRGADGRFRSFGKNYQEQNFIAFTQEAMECNARATDLLAQVDFNNEPQAQSLLAEALAQVERYRDIMSSFMKDDGSGRQAVTPEFFYSFFRRYFPTYDIAGVSYGPPTAANAVPCMALDFALGLKNSDYAEHVLARKQYFEPRELKWLQAQMGSDSLLTRVLKHLDTQPQASQSASTQLVLKICKQVAGASSTHWALLANFLQKPARKELMQMKGRGIDLSKGSSGMEFEEVEQLRDMRRLHPLVQELQERLKN